MVTQRKIPLSIPLADACCRCRETCGASELPAEIHSDPELLRRLSGPFDDLSEATEIPYD